MQSFGAEPFFESLLREKALFPVSGLLAGRMEWDEWRSQLKELVRNALGRMNFSDELGVKELERVEYAEYTRIKIAYETEPGLETPAYLLTPAYNQTGAAVLAVHGHGYGVKDIVGLNPDGSERTGAPGYQKDFALSLVKKGFLVFAPELMGFGELRFQEDKDAPHPDTSSCRRLATALLMYGRTLAGVRVEQCIRALDIMGTIERIDRNRIGCMGISGGGLVCSFLTALDERVKAAVISGYANSFRESIFTFDHCVDNYLPGLSLGAELEDVLSLIAPRPMLWESGIRDPMFPIAAAKEAARTVRRVYRLLGKENLFEHDIFDADHQISGDRSFDFLAEHL